MKVTHNFPKRINTVVTTTTVLAALVVCTSAGRADLVYISNWNADTIDKLDSGGSYLGYYNSFHPRSIGLDSGGNLYVAEWGSQSIIKYTPSGVSSVFASGLQGVEGLTVDSGGNVYVTELWDHNIMKFTPAGVGSVFGNTGNNDAYSLAFDSSGNLYVSEFNANRIEKFTAPGVSSVFVTGLSSPYGLAFDNGGSLYVANYGGHTIQKFAPGGGSSSIFASGLTDPAGIAFDSTGNLYVADEWALPNYGAVMRFTPGGVGSVFYSGAYSGPVSVAIRPVPEPSSMILIAFAAGVVQWIGPSDLPTPSRSGEAVPARSHLCDVLE